MKTSIRNKRFTMVIVLFLVIIVSLSVASIYYLNKLVKKTSAILKENHYSVVYARNMSNSLININQEITNCIIENKYPDSIFINKELRSFEHSLILENNNITEIGEDKLAAGIGTGFYEYRDSINKFIKSPQLVSIAISLQNKFNYIYQQLMLLSHINEKAIEEKTNDAKISAKEASIQMSFITALCFLIAYGFSFSFTSYFNDRFLRLYEGIKELVSSNYRKRLFFKGNDEFYEISNIINEMAEKLSGDNEKKTLTLHDSDTNDHTENIEELKEVLNRIKNIEQQAIQLISKLENS